MEILIINPPIRLTDKPRHIPHGLAILANIIEKKLGIVPQFLDLNAYRYSIEDTKNMLKRYKFDVVLIGGLIPVYKRIIALSELIKEANPDALIISGGSASMSVPELLLKNSKVDIVCAGEGEIAIIDLLKRVRDDKQANLIDVKGFYFKAEDEIVFSGNRELIVDLDNDSDVPAYHLLPMDIYLSNPVIGFGRDIDFISSRGCPYSCTFCYQPWGRNFRGHSVDFVLDALKYLKKNYAIDFVSFQDDEFMANPKRVYDFCDKVQSCIPGLLWSCTGRVNLVSDDIVCVMRNAGCVSISYGFESGSPRILKSMNKKVTLEQMENAVTTNRKYNMMVPVSFIIGMPGEDDVSCKETVEFCIRNNLPLKSIMFATPYPGTELFENALSMGRIKREKMHEFVMNLEDARDFTVNLTDVFTDKQLIAKRAEMIDMVCAKVKLLSVGESMEKLHNLFGSLVADYLKDEALLKHRAEHGGIDIF
ncbi:MAG TPA: B12-binding domain-containing radical SAM protein [Candidatus Wujingus californicus]|uniref:B12-binding domain-containing radical SAM protein n=1 Tax=Candidatus Wujingus californicus TaxID=3367618 RepID=UPI001DF56BD6|nr:radical SAM protein [Planctomycetota bacterium]MDO8131045.1 radical SAM protein [Candidatus Brocadiales bacterium]